MHLFGLLRITCVYTKPECMPMKHTKCVANETCKMCVAKHVCSYKPKCTSAVHATSEVHANQRCMRTVHTNHDAHGSRLTSCVYLRGLNLCALNMHFYVIDLSCTCRLCCKYFQKLVESCNCLTCL